MKRRFEIKNKKRFLIVFWSILVLPIIGAVVLFALIANGHFGTLPTFEELENPRSNLATDIISEDGQLLGSLFVENRSFVDYDDLSPYLVAALISTEDARFYRHSGVDIPSLFRVAFRTLLLAQNQGGGSTISQQLAKNLYPRDTTRYDSNISRHSALVIAKLKEWITAVMLEHNYTKEEIIVMYLNVVEYGSNAYGIKSASQTFFGKTPRELTIEEAAMLVGVVNAPTRFSPVRNYKNAFKRRNTVLSRMEQHGFISKKELDSLKRIKINLTYQPISHDVGVATYFRTMLRLYMTATEPKKTPFITVWDYKQLVKQWNEDPLYGWCNKNKKADGTPYNIYKDGLKIYTTINYKMQKYAEEAVIENMKNNVQPNFDAQAKANHSIFVGLTPEEEADIIKRAIKQTDRYRRLRNSGASEAAITKNFNTPVDMTVFTYDNRNGRDTVMTPRDSILYSKRFLRSGLVAIEPSSGYLKAYVGGVNYRYFMYDMASQGRRQAGSTFKPYVYTFAIDQVGLTPCSPVPNSPVNIEGWSPKEAGPVPQEGELRPLWWGMALSRNNFSAWIMQQAGQPAAVADFIHKLGIKSYINPTPSLCLGTADVSLLEMTGAYTDFVNMGVHIEPIFVTRIEDRHGNILATFAPQSHDAISQQSAFNMLELLQNVVNRGTAIRLRRVYQFAGEMGGKTGTTNNNSDAWFMGVTPKIVAGVWVGGEDRSIHPESRGEGSVMALPAYALFMQKIYKDTSLGISESDTFVKPVGVQRHDCPGLLEEAPEFIDEVDVDRTKNDSDGFFDM
ncbi:MAG: penicillin-binding protein [Rikenellaceae bacterium]|nr:penicillin-binding protein [Rikenellaceae bacterium]